MTAIASLTVGIDDITERDKDACYLLLTEQFLGIRRAEFERDFAEKEAVLMLRAGGASGPIVGFSTIMTLPLPLAGRRARAIFSGDTVVDPRYRFSSGALRELGAYFLRTLRRFPDDEIHYVLISKGWRTYKLMLSLFRSFAPPGERAVIDAFGALKYPRAYNAAAGVIRGGADAPRVRPESIDAMPPKIDAHTAFFLRANPGYLAGDELVCAGRVAPENFAAPLRRMLARSGGARDEDRLAAVGASLGR